MRQKKNTFRLIGAFFGELGDIFGKKLEIATSSSQKLIMRQKNNISLIWRIFGELGGSFGEKMEIANNGPLNSSIAR